MCIFNISYFYELKKNTDYSGSHEFMHFSAFPTILEKKKPENYNFYLDSNKRHESI